MSLWRASPQSYLLSGRSQDREEILDDPLRKHPMSCSVRRLRITTRGTTVFGFYIDSSRERTLGGKRFVSTSLAAPESIVDVTNTESLRFRQSPLAKAIYAPRSEHVASSKELLVGFVVREVRLTEISRHHFAIAQAWPTQKSSRLPHNVSHLAINTAKSISVACGVHQRARTSDCTDVWRGNRSGQYLQLLGETHVDSE